MNSIIRELHGRLAARKRICASGNDRSKALAGNARIRILRSAH